MTRFEFSGTRRNLCTTTSDRKYIPPPCFGIAIGRRRFDALFQCITFSNQPMRSADMTSAEHRRALVNDFVKAINEHRERRLRPLETLCIDESMSRWYGLGGHWFEIGLPHYVALDRKPENGCEIYTCACTKSGIIVRLELVTTAQDEQHRTFENMMNHGTAAMRRLVGFRSGTGRHVCADSYFSSVEAAEKLLEIGLKYTGVVKTSTKRYPMDHLGTLEMDGQGDCATYTSTLKDKKFTIMAVTWVDRTRRYFISSTGSNIPGNPVERERWTQTQNGPMKVEITFAQPQVVEKYYDACAAIDIHNRCRQDVLCLEKKVEVKDWYKRVGFTLFGICVVDAWLAYKGGRGSMAHMNQAEFYECLAEELIDNNFDAGACPKKRMHESSDESSDLIVVTSGRKEHSAPTKRRRLSNGKATKARAQGRCKLYLKFESKFVCSQCRDGGKE